MKRLHVLLAALAVAGCIGCESVPSAVVRQVAALDSNNKTIARDLRSMLATGSLPAAETTAHVAALLAAQEAGLASLKSWTVAHEKE